MQGLQQKLGVMQRCHIAAELPRLYNGLQTETDTCRLAVAKSQSLCLLWILELLDICGFPLVFWNSAADRQF